MCVLQLLFNTPYYIVSCHQDSPEENQTSPSPTGYYSSPLSIHRVENFDRIKDRVEQPSPVSVLEEFFVEDITSPLCAEFQPGKLLS